MKTTVFLLGAIAILGCTRPWGAPQTEPSTAKPMVIRVATFNLEDVRTEDVQRADHPRLKAAAAMIQRIRPDVIFLNEIAFDPPDAQGESDGGQNGRRFAENYLAVSQGDGLQPIKYQAFMAPSNTGISSGHDLDNNGKTVTNPDGENGGIAYGADCWGFGEFPGQFAMALLVRDGIEIVNEDIRTFGQFRWSHMPEALRPVDPKTGQSWYTDETWEAFPLSSKSHWDVPVRLPGGQVVHLLCSHPTPPVFDGPEDRNGCRNHDEIRFWADYLNGQEYIVDDKGQAGGLADDAHFVILGDLNSDPVKGEGVDRPVERFLFRHQRIQSDFVPQASRQGRDAYPQIHEADTADWGMRADYVLPSNDLEILDGGIERPNPNEGVKISDHFLVWIELRLPD